MSLFGPARALLGLVVLGVLGVTFAWLTPGSDAQAVNDSSNLVMAQDQVAGRLDAGPGQVEGASSASGVTPPQHTDFRSKTTGRASQKSGGTTTMPQTEDDDASSPPTTTTTAPPTTTTTTAQPVTKTTPSGCDVSVSGNQSIQPVVDSQPSGATICLSGTFTGQSVTPKADQTFQGPALLDGNGTPMAFSHAGNINGVTLRYLTVEDYAPPQTGGFGAVKGGAGWTLDSNVIRNNSGTGVYHEAGMHMVNNTIHNNSLAGVGGYKAHGSVIEGNEFYENGVLMVSGISTAAKWAQTNGIVIRNNFFHNNYRHAIWMDGDNINVLIEDNTVTNNSGVGIYYEISCGGTVRNNLIEDNGTSGLHIVASQDVTFQNNTLNRNDLEVWHQQRSGGVNCPWELDNVVLDANIMVGGRVEIHEWQVDDPGTIFQPGDTRFTFTNNVYTNTTFHNPGSVSWAEWQAAGNDPTGTFSGG